MCLIDLNEEFTLIIYWSLAASELWSKKFVATALQMDEVNLDGEQLLTLTSNQGVKKWMII